MNYNKIYNKLCSSRKYRGLVKEAGYEIHHIRPRCMGGGDDSSNLVKLTVREHCIAHKLLTKFVKGKYKYKLLTAYKLMYSLHKNSKDVEKIKNEINLWKGKFLIVPRYIDQDPITYFKTLNFYGFNKVLLPIGSKEYYNTNTSFTYNKVRHIIDKYELPYDTKSLIFTEVDISKIGEYKGLNLKDLYQGVGCDSVKATLSSIPCNTEYIGKFNNPVRYKDIIRINTNLPKEVSEESNYSEEDYEFYSTVNTLTLDHNEDSIKSKYLSMFKYILKLERVSPKYFTYTINLLIHLSKYKAVRLPRDCRGEVMDRCVNMLLSTGYVKVKKGCKYYDKGEWLEDMLIVSKDKGDEVFYVKAKRDYGDVRLLFKSMCFDLGVEDIFL